jgi:hypothetical protein
LQRGIVTERVMTDNAFAYTKNRSLRELLQRRAIDDLLRLGCRDDGDVNGDVIVEDSFTRGERLLELPR